MSIKKALIGIFNNIIPATFQDSETYLEQQEIIKDKVNELVDVVNAIIESGGSGYILPPATTEILGGIKVGNRLTIDEDGVLSADEQGGGSVDPYVLPIASSEILGGIKVGQNLTIEEDGTLNAQAGGGGGTVDPYVLPTASREVKGGVKVSGEQGVVMDGEFIKIKFDPSTMTIDSNGNLKVLNGGGGSYKLPVASYDTLGGVYTPGEVVWAPEGFETANAIQNQEGKIFVQVGKGITLNAEGAVGYLSVKVGTGLYFDEQGRLCASGGGGTVSAGLVDEISMETTQQEGSGITETLAVDDSVMITKF